MSSKISPNIVTDGLILCLDASNKNSYPEAGTTWYDLSGTDAHGTINGTITYVADGLRSYFNFATASDANYISSAFSQSYLDMTVVFEPDFSDTLGIAGLIGSSTAAVGADKSLRFVGVDGTGPWNLTSRNPGDGNDWANPDATTYYVNGNVSNILVPGWNILGGYRTNQSGFPSSFAYFLGSSAYASRGFQGKFAAIWMYNRQLTGIEALQNYYVLKARFGLA